MYLLCYIFTHIQQAVNFVSDIFERLTINGFPVTATRVPSDYKLPPPFDIYEREQTVLAKLTHKKALCDPLAKQLVEELKEAFHHLVVRSKRGLMFMACDR